MSKTLLLICFFICCIASLNAQRIKQDVLMKKAGFDTCEIHAFQYRDGHIVAKGHRLDLFTVAGLSLGSISYDSLGKVISENRKEVSADGLTTISYHKNQKGEIEYKTIYRETPDHKKLYYYQVNMNGDTLVAQYRIYNHLGLDSMLYTQNRKGKYQLTTTWEYDSIGRVIRVDRFDPSDKGIINKKEYKYSSNSDCYLIFSDESLAIICMQSMTDTITFRKPSTGYNYGITFEKQQGGKEVITYRPDGLMEERIVYSPQGAIINRVRYTYR